MISSTCWIYLVGLLIPLGNTYAQSCGDSNSPVAVMCYNNDITFDSTAYATSDGVASGSRDCKCVVSSDGGGLKIKLQMKPSSARLCEQNTIKLIQDGSLFSTTLTCQHQQTSTFSIGGGVTLRQNFRKRTNDPVCLQYMVTGGQGRVKVTCTGDKLPTTTKAVTKPQSTGPTKSLHESTSTLSNVVTQSSSPSSGASQSTIKSITTTTTGITAEETTTTSISPVTSGQTTSSVLVTSGTSYSSSLNNASTTTTSTEDVLFTGNGTEGTPPTTTTPQTKTTAVRNPSSDNKNLGGIIAGAVIGSIAFAVLLALLVVFIYRRRQKRRRQKMHKRLSENGAVENPCYVTHEKAQMDAPNGKGDFENGIQNNLPVQESEGEALYATIDKRNKLQKADTLF